MATALETPVPSDSDPSEAHTPAERVPAEPLHASYPRSFFYIMGAVVGQSYVFVGLQCVLAMYMSDWLGLSDAHSTAFVALFLCLTNLFSLVGGLVADNFVGNYKAQLWSCAAWAVGSIILLFTVIPGIYQTSDVTLLVCVTIGLLLISIGSGAIQPTQSAFVGDQFAGVLEEDLASFFSVLYFFMNVGNVVGESLNPILRQRVGFKVVLPILCGITILSSLFYWGGKKHYVRIPPKPRPAGTSVLRQCLPLKEDWPHLISILKVFAPLPVWWALFYQQNNTWVFQAKKMDRHWGALTIPPDAGPSFNDGLILLLIPLLDRFVYPALQRCKLPLTPLRRITLGMMFTTTSFVLAGLVESVMLSSEEKTVNMAWQIPQYVCVSIAEVLVAIPGLEFAYSQAPERMRSVVTALWYLASALGTALLAAVALVKPTNQAFLFFGYAVLLALITLLFIWIVRDYTYVEFEGHSNTVCSAGEERGDAFKPLLDATEKTENI